MAKPEWTFSEREFYLAEFRGRTLGIALAEPPGGSLDALDSVVSELAKNGVRCVVVSPSQALLETVSETVIEAGEGSEWVGELWRGLRGGRSVGLWLPAASAPGDDEPAGFAARCASAVLELRLAKLVWIDPRGWLRDRANKRISLLDLSDLGKTSDAGVFGDPGSEPLIEQFRRMLAGGIGSVNVCALEGLAEELFTYAGSGTLLTPERYLEVRRLGVDDLDAASNLIARGVEEGYLAPRGEAAVEAALARAFGVFIEGRYLAGIGSLIGYPAEEAGEITNLYTLTRFAGEGVGGYLVSFALERAREQGLRRVFACTTSPRVQGFFERQGFAVVAGAELPASKWADYPPERREKLCCLARKTD
ncbi:MAG: GNAT family N-acetyltransferase [Myxococcota bacterium]|nr:GNAT family N-acetyltransferase [Myxococcota bacterium]